MPPSDMNHLFSKTYNKRMYGRQGGTMKLERLAENMIKFSLSYQELIHLGLSEDMFWKDPAVWIDLMDELLEEAADRLGFQIYDTIAVEIETTHEEELILIVTFNYEDTSIEETTTLPSVIGDKNMQDPLKDSVICSFRDWEEVIAFCGAIYHSKKQLKSHLYYGQSVYYLVIDVGLQERERIAALREEYHAKTKRTYTWVQEYAKELISMEAIEKVVAHFLVKKK
jgi:adapter protein MecA 1/2